MLKILICGASGFIGRNLFEILSQRPDLDVYGTYLNRRFSKNKRLRRADLTDQEWAREVTKGMDVVINAAAITDGSGAVAANPGRYITNNIRINTNLIEGAHENNVSHFIFLSCSILYPANSATPLKETDIDLSLIHPRYYTGARMKLFSEDLCHFFSTFGKTRFTIIRHSNNYGPFDKFDTTKGHVFSATIEKIMSPSNDRVIVWGDGHERRDFLHVFDLVSFIEMAIEHKIDGSSVFNVGSGYSLSVRELVEKMRSLASKSLPIHYDLTKQSIDTNIILDTTRAREILGWQPQIGIDEGIQQTINWYQKTAKEKTEARL